MQKRLSKDQIFILSLFGLSLCYLAFELFFNRYAMIIADEFWFAHAAYQFKDALPYRDFPPYKTVLGYYFLMLPMLIASTKPLLSIYVFVKDFIALINIAVLLSATLQVKKYFSQGAIILSLALVLTAENTLLYSSNIRVDLFAYWFGLFALICIFNKRYYFAGILLGLGFITSQKVIWYFAAIQLAFFAVNLLSGNLKKWRPLLHFNLAFLGILLLYISYWAYYSSLYTVIDSVFFEAKAMYQLDWYAIARKPFWAVVLLNNPFLFLTWPIGLLSIIFKHHADTQYSKRVFLFTILTCLFIFLIPYKQVFPYYMQVIMPIFFLFYAAFFSWLFRFLKNPVMNISKNALITALVFSVAYLFLLVFLKFWMHLLTIYIALALIPFALTAMAYNANNAPSHNDLYRYPIFFSVVFIGFIYPFTLFVPALAALDGHYQKANLTLLHELIADGSDYVAGTDFIYNKSQPVPGMQHLNGPGVDYLFQPFSPKLRHAMIASLNFDPSVTLPTIFNRIKKSNIKVYINNYRMDSVPKPLKTFLASEFTHYWGSLYVYAPVIPVETRKYFVKFTGNYQILSSPLAVIRINKQHYQKNDSLHLVRGEVQIEADTPFRLQLIPHITSGLIQKNIPDQWIKMI